MTTSKLITKSDPRKVFFRSFPMEWTWNYEKQQNLGYTYALIPIIEKLYKDKPEEKAAALQRQENCKEPNYQRTRMQKDVVIQELKKRGCRITKQRRMLLEVILENECSCCKEIYYNASRLDPGIGSATVYRMVNLLEEIGAISRRNMYKIVRNPDCKDESVCTIELDDNTVQKLSKDSFNNVVLTGLKACGYIDKQEIERMFVNSCDFK